MKRLSATWLSSVAVLFITAGLSQQAFGLVADDEARRAILDLRARLEMLNNRVSDLEKSLQNSAQGQIQLLNENERLRSEIARLRGRLEETDSAAQTGRSRQKDLYVDLDTRLREQRELISAFENKIKQLEPVVIEVSGERYRVSQTERSQFLDLKTAIDEKDFKKAIRLSLQFEKEFPTSALLGDVVFIKGTALYADSDPRASAAARREFLSRFPSHPLSAQAKLNLAASLAETGNPNTSRRVLEELVKSHPKSPEAAEAKKRLK